MMNIYLMGYMGSGKSAVGKELATRLGYSLIDFDDYIETKENATISSIFKEKGEIYFRKKEAAYLIELTETIKDKTIISLGGGTPCYGVNLETIKKTGSISLYLNTSVQELTARLWGERSKRPLISLQESQESLEEYIRKHLFERGFYYNQARHSIKTNDKSVNDIVQEIMTELF